MKISDIHSWAPFGFCSSGSVEPNLKCVHWAQHTCQDFACERSASGVPFDKCHLVLDEMGKLHRARQIHGVKNRFDGRVEVPVLSVGSARRKNLAVSALDKPSLLVVFQSDSLFTCGF